MRNGLLWIAIIALAACGSAEVAEVVDRSVESGAARAPESAGAARTPALYVTVARGDTLYAIAFRHGVDFRRLAAINDIRPPYTIYPGQRLRLDPTEPARSAAAPTPRRTRAGPVPHVGPLPLPPARAEPVSPRRAPVAARAPEARDRGSVTTASTPFVSAPTTTPPAPTPPPARIAPGRTRQSAGIHWRWPAQGQVMSRFVAGDPARQGIDVRGTDGAPVLAVADGQVVYSGNGLLGYGELIIIKHSNAFLSAYGHNRRRLLGEGARVQAGQQIAEMGRSGAGLNVLHFEIRRNGKPMDPLALLPSR